MKYMLLMTNAQPGPATAAERTPEEIEASGHTMGAIHAELTERGELVGGEGLAGPEAAKIVTFDGVTAPVVTDGPFPEAKEFLAGYWMVDVESEERAVEIAAKTSAAAGPGTAGREIQVRAVMSPPDMEP